MAGIFNVDWRKLFEQAQPPKKRAEQTLDLGESLLATIKIDGEALNVLDTTLQVEKKYNCVKMVMEASLDEFFSEATFNVETVTTIVRWRYWFTELEAQSIFLGDEGSSESIYHLFREDETPADASIIVHVPSALFISSFEKVDAQVKKLKVAGKSYKLVTL